MVCPYLDGVWKAQMKASLAILNPRFVEVSVKAQQWAPISPAHQSSEMAIRIGCTWCFPVDTGSVSLDRFLVSLEGSWPLLTEHPLWVSVVQAVHVHGVYAMTVRLACRRGWVPSAEPPHGAAWLVPADLLRSTQAVHKGTLHPSWSAEPFAMCDGKCFTSVFIPGPRDFCALG